VFCKGKDGAGRQITYFDVLKDFRFMADKGFDYEFIRDERGRITRDVFSGTSFRPRSLNCLVL
jgi:hypothetical protein